MSAQGISTRIRFESAHTGQVMVEYSRQNVPSSAIEAESSRLGNAMYKTSTGISPLFAQIPRARYALELLTSHPKAHTLMSTQLLNVIVTYIFSWVYIQGKMFMVQK